MELSTTYNPKEVEGKIYKLWEESGFFNPDNLPGKRNKTYSIVVPPPNVTGNLHMGHALNATAQDILIRWKRLLGFKTLWIPGTDHAGIATQNVVEKSLRKEGISRFDLGREKFIEKVWEWKEKYGNIILDQFKKIGCSMDWSRTRFTMDEKYSEAVRTAFLNYYSKGLIYRGKRVVNWCPRCQTSLSDLEIEFKEEAGNLWNIRYPLKNEVALRQDQGGNFITVATTRPETMLGDTAVAVNPKDKRYKNLIGKKVILPLVNREIPIIEDRLIDMEFGTGAVKITPAHDLIDAEIGTRHDLEVLQVIDERGKINQNAPLPYQGLSVLEARQKIVSDLQNLNLLEKIEDYTHQIPKCYRCNATIELIPSEQWFLKMEKLAKMAKDPVKSGKIKFHPKNFEKPYFDWLENVKDWCISRQIWWGHKIPIEGSEDVLDTWFSAALWPFATLGWPASANTSTGKTGKITDLKEFYPTSVLSTARDIIYLWVTRMIFSGMEFMKEIPFKDVYIHATVLTKEGKRMSKSLGTGIDPLLLIEKYGADATRFGICYQIMGNQDMKFVEDNIVMGKKFCNKIWNASRFVQGRIGESSVALAKEDRPHPKTKADKEILKKLEETKKTINKNLENFEFGQAAHAVYDFFWHDFCDNYIEESKKQQDEKTQKILLYVLKNSLILLHPFIPFITEEIYQNLPLEKREKFLMIENWPPIK